MRIHWDSDSEWDSGEDYEMGDRYGKRGVLGAYVLRLEVAVEDAARVAVGEATQDLEQEDLRAHPTEAHVRTQTRTRITEANWCSTAKHYSYDTIHPMIQYVVQHEYL